MNRSIVLEMENAMEEFSIRFSAHLMAGIVFRLTLPTLIVISLNQNVLEMEYVMKN